MRELRQDWRDIFCAFRIAIDPKKMVLGFIGVVVSIAILLAILLAFRGAFPQAGIKVIDLLVAPVESVGDFSQTVARHISPSAFQWKDAGLLVIAGILMLLVWSFFGGAILRSAAVEFCKDDRIDADEATKFAKKKFSSFFWAPVVPCLGVAFFMLCVYVGGLVGRIPHVGPVLVGLFFCLALLAGFLSVLIGLGTVFGNCLMGPTVATEGTDAFDAMSRSFSYVYGRPWRFIWYHLVGCVYWLVSVAFVTAFAWLVIHVSIAAGAYGMGRSFEPVGSFVLRNERAFDATAMQNFCAIFMKAGVVVVWGLVAGFCVSMVLTINTVIYCLLRKDVDGTDMTELFVEEDEEEKPVPEPETTPAEKEGAAEESDESGAKQE